MKQMTPEEKYIQMTQTPVEKLIGVLSVPTIISMLITTIYNMADTFFIGMLDNTSASGAVGIAFSLMAVIQAVGFYFGQGAGNTASRLLGEHRQQEAEELASTGFVLAFLFGGALLLFGEIFLDPLAVGLGSTDTILPYAREYIRIVLIGAPYMTASLVLNNLLRFQGNALYGMIGLTTGGVLNIVLDPVMMFGLNLGISGAAAATIISQFVSFLILLYQCNKVGIVKIRLRNFKPSLQNFGMINNGGLPSLLRQGVGSVASVCLNVAAKPFGDAAIAAMAIVSRIMLFTNSVVIGLGQGFQPVCGYNYGAKLYARVRRAFWFCVKISAAFLVVVAAVEIALAPQFVELFRKGDPEVVRIGAAALRCQCATIVVASWIIMSNMMMQTTGQVVPASLLGICRQGLLLIPLVFLMPFFWGETGLVLAQPVADVISVIIAIPLQMRILRKMRQDELAMNR